MAKSGTYARVFIDGFAFSCATSELEVGISVSENDSSTLCSTAEDMDPSLSTGSITINGFFIGADAGLEEALHDRLATSNVLVSAIFGIDEVVAAGWTIPNSYGGSVDIAAPTSGLITMNGTFGAGDGIKHTVCVDRDKTVTATGTSTERNNVSAGSAGGKAWLHVTAISGTATNATIALESAAATGMSGATSEGTFTFSAVGAYEIALSGTIGQFLRSNVTSMGGATSITYTLVANVNNVN